MLRPQRGSPHRHEREKEPPEVVMWVLMVLRVVQLELLLLLEVGIGVPCIRG